jgi:hypothetical protein
MGFVKNVCNNLGYGYRGTFSCNLLLYGMGQYAIGVAALPLRTIIHESGHAIAAHLLLKNAKPKIKLVGYGYGGGSCSCNHKSLSKVGEWLGTSNASAIVTAAGPVIEMIASLALSRFFPGNGISCVGSMMNSISAIVPLFEKAFYTGKMEDHIRNDYVKIYIKKGGLAAGTLIITSVVLATFELYSLLRQSVANAY